MMERYVKGLLQQRAQTSFAVGVAIFQKSNYGFVT